MKEIDKLAVKIYLQNKKVGWWDDPNRCIYETLQLVSTEIAEATEGERKTLMDDHLPHRIMGEVELADAMIRLLDLGGRYGWKYIDVSHHMMLNDIDSIGGKHLTCNVALIDLTKSIHYGASNVSTCYSVLISTILEVGESRGYDIPGALYEKFEYNKNRADHKRENRAKEGGKKF